MRKWYDTQVPPKADKPSESRAIVLQIGPGGELSINKQAVASTELGEKLAAIYAARGTDRTLFVDADDQVPYETVVRALDVARGPGGVRDIGFVVN
jgi:biopolymer transport protein ExbD